MKGRIVMRVGPPRPRVYDRAPAVLRAPFRLEGVPLARRRLAQEAALDYIGALGPPNGVELARAFTATRFGGGSTASEGSTWACPRVAGIDPLIDVRQSWEPLRAWARSTGMMIAWDAEVASRPLRLDDKVLRDNNLPVRPDGAVYPADLRATVADYLRAGASWGSPGVSLTDQRTLVFGADPNAPNPRAWGVRAVGAMLPFNYPLYPNFLLDAPGGAARPWAEQGTWQIGLLPAAYYRHIVTGTEAVDHWIGFDVRGRMLTANHTHDLFPTGLHSGTATYDLTAGRIRMDDFRELVPAVEGWWELLRRGCMPVTGTAVGPRVDQANYHGRAPIPRRIQQSVFTGLSQSGLLGSTVVALPGEYPLAVTAVAQTAGYDFEREYGPRGLIAAHNAGVLHLVGCQPVRAANTYPAPSSITAARVWPVETARAGGGRMPWVFWYTAADRIAYACPAAVYDMLAAPPTDADVRACTVMPPRPATGGYLLTALQSATEVLVSVYAPTALASVQAVMRGARGGATGIIVEGARTLAPGAMQAVAASDAGAHIAKMLSDVGIRNWADLDPGRVRSVMRTWQGDASRWAQRNVSEMLQSPVGDKLKTAVGALVVAGVAAETAVGAVGDHVLEVNRFSRKALRASNASRVDLAFDMAEVVGAWSNSAGQSSVVQTLYGASSADSASDLFTAMQAPDGTHLLATDPSVMRAALDFRAHNRGAKLGLNGGARTSMRLLETAAAAYQAECSQAAREALANAVGVLRRVMSTPASQAIMRALASSDPAQAFAAMDDIARGLANGTLVMTDRGPMTAADYARQQTSVKSLFLTAATIAAYIIAG